MSKMHIEVNQHGINMYSAVIHKIWDIMHDRKMDKLGDLIVCLKIDDDVPQNELLLFDGDAFAYTWYNDWDEGCSKVTILGFMFVDEVEMISDAFE